MPIRMYATDLQSGARWYLDRLASGPGTCPLKVTEHATTADVAAAVAADRGGLGLVGTRTAWPGVRAVALEIPADAVPLPDAVVGSTRPPTLRPLFLVVAVPTEGEWPAALHEFVAYVLSYFGQLDVAKDGLLPLSRAELHAQRELLGWAVQR
jgi:ABC-type phosphate transport system substrate-binding protein